MKGVGTPVTIAATIAVAIVMALAYAVLGASHSARVVTRRFGRRHARP